MHLFTVCLHHPGKQMTHNSNLKTDNTLITHLNIFSIKHQGLLSHIKTLLTATTTTQYILLSHVGQTSKSFALCRVPLFQWQNTIYTS